MQKVTDTWFASWFDSPYYHILYKDRNYEEAGAFMNQLTAFLKLPKQAKILDLACGKGRHSKYLNKLGYDVTGVDLSPNSIQSAKKFENDTLHFAVHDMCLPYPETFDAVFNLFTSFGYFETETDNVRTLKAIKAELKKGGFGVIDFLNSEYVRENLVAKEEKIVDGINFKIERVIENNYIIKNISFIVNEEDHFHTEKVKALTLQDFKSYFKESGITLQYCFGDYKLQPFNAKLSKRLILIFN